MNDINKHCWCWFGCYWKVGDKFDTNSHLYNLNDALGTFFDVPSFLEDDWRIYKVIDNVVTQVLTIKETRRILKLKRL